MGVRGDLERRREQRQRSTARAGASAAGFASRRIDAFLRRRWRPMAIVAGGSVVFAAAIWFLLPGSDGARGFAAGAFIAAMGGALYHWAVLASGAAGTSMGQAAEEWTSSDLRRLRRRGWQTLDHLILRPPADIDHVAIGPDGVLVIETKWRSIRTDLGRPSSWLNDATSQVRRSERDLAGHLGWRAHEDARITPLLVVWGPEITQVGDGPLAGPNGVNVVAGQHLQTVLDDLGEAHLDEAEVERIYSKLAKQMDTTDRWAAAAEAVRPATLAEVANAWAARVAAGIASFTLVVLSLNLGWFAVAATLAVAAVGLAARPRDGLRPVASAWLSGVAAALLLVIGAVTASVV